MIKECNKFLLLQLMAAYRFTFVVDLEIPPWSMYTTTNMIV